jgi:hypothetical protein
LRRCCCLFETSPTHRSKTNFSPCSGRRTGKHDHITYDSHSLVLHLTYFFKVPRKLMGIWHSSVRG